MILFIFIQDRVPADGIVKAGRSTIDESSFTGEPYPVTKLPGVYIPIIIYGPCYQIVYSKFCYFRLKLQQEALI